jgi:hypothetical protein
MHAALVREGVSVGPNQTGQLLRQLGLHGVRRGRKAAPPCPDAAGDRAADHAADHAADPS